MSSVTGYVTEYLKTWIYATDYRGRLSVVALEHRHEEDLVRIQILPFHLAWCNFTPENGRGFFSDTVIILQFVTGNIRATKETREV